MPHEGGVDSAIAIELFFEGKDDERLVDVLAQKLDAPLPPCPELWTDVVDDGNAALAHLARHPPVESGRIDDDGKVGAALVGGANQFFVKAENFWEMADDLSDTDDGEVFGVDDDVAAGGAHAVSARAEERDAAGDSSAQSFNQLRSIHFARSFARRDQNLHAAIVRERALRATTVCVRNAFSRPRSGRHGESPGAVKSHRIAIIVVAV